MGGKGQRHEHLGGWQAGPGRHHDDDGDERRDGAVDADQGGEDRHEETDDHEQARAALTTAGQQLLPGPRGDTGGVQRLTDDEERRDEDDRRVPEARERVVEVEDPGQPQRDRDPDGDDAERTRFDMNATTAMTRMSNVIATGLMRGA